MSEQPLAPLPERTGEISNSDTRLRELRSAQMDADPNLFFRHLGPDMVGHFTILDTLLSRYFGGDWNERFLKFVLGEKNLRRLDNSLSGERDNKQRK